MSNLENLNSAQKKAVLVTDGPMMILAGAGSGKTRTLVTKISYLLQEKGISPYQILTLTFSNKAAKEMRDRVANQVGIDIGALQITTFHSFCAQILRSEATYIGLSRNFTIYDSGESKAVAKTLLKRRGISTKEMSPYEILYFIEDLKNRGFYVGRETFKSEVDTSDPLYTYYQEYEAELHRANALDFGGLIIGTIQLFEKFPDVLERYTNRFKYILVDEYQDTNGAQFDLIKLLCAKRNNICVVGDEDQSIYSWRGADINNILDFEKRFPNAVILKLEQNYRSSKNIIDAASCVVARNSLRKGKQLWTDNPEGDIISIVECQSEKSEGEFVAAKIKELNETNIKFNDIAVFYRTNSQSRVIEDHLRTNNLPYRVVGGIKFYERKEIKDLLAYLRLIVNSKDSLAFSRIINVPPRGIGATTLRKLETEAINSKSSLWEIVDRITSNPEEFSFLKLNAKVKSALGSFTTLLHEAKILEQERVLPHIIYDKIVNESGYLESLKAARDYESLARIENLQELTSGIKQFEENSTSPTLSVFLETITLDTNSNEDELTQNLTGEISLMTVHGAKGLEFPYVFIVGTEENIFPSYKSLEDCPSASEEERRLFYVAMTRAMKRLFISFAQARMLFGQRKFNGPSRFIHEIPEKFFHWEKFFGENDKQNQPSSNWKDSDFSQETDASDEVVYQINATKYSAKFPKGSRVVHSLFGTGKVLENEGHGPEEKVLIKFNDGAIKKFMVKYAPIEIA